jgi:predicted  nucleic acid-binding Zn-ribbon protein
VQVDTIPAWLAAVGALLVIASTLGAAVAVYKNSVQGTSLRVARETLTDLRGEITDYERRETKLESDVQILKAKNGALSDRCTVLEDLLTKRKDDDEIRAEIAAVRKVVDENVIAQLSAILQLLEGGAKA